MTPPSRGPAGSGRGLPGLLIALALGFGAGPLAAAASAPTSDDILQPGPHGVGHMGAAGSLVLEDTARGRTFQLEIWYPTLPPAPPADALAEQEEAPLASAGAPYPLVVYSHGFMSSSDEGRILDRNLASHGTIVAAPRFPFTHFDAPGGPDLLDVVNQPGDVTFVIDTLLAWNEAPGNRFEAGVDGARIGLVGLSLGGMTTLLTAFHRDLRDPRVSAAAAMAAPSAFFSDIFYDFADVPLMLLAANRDAIVGYVDNALPAFERANAPRFLVTLIGGSHTGWSFFGPAAFEDVDNPDTIGCAAIAGTVPSDPAEGQAFLDALGDATAGIIPPSGPLPCQDELAGFLSIRSMRPSRQHELTILAVRPFLDLYLSRDALRAQQAEAFLASSLDAENEDLTSCRDDAVCLPEPPATILAVAALTTLIALRTPRRWRIQRSPFSYSSTSARRISCSRPRMLQKRGARFSEKAAPPSLPSGMSNQSG